MRVPPDLNSMVLVKRAATVATSMTNSQIRILNAVVLSVSILSTVGAGWIILSFVVCHSLAPYSVRILIISGVQITENFQTPAHSVNNILTIETLVFAH
jgi:hypothetical protein